MCCFSRPVRYVADTEIFARLSGRGTQFLVYQMTFASDEPNAMVLPLPSISRVRFVSFQNYAHFFDDVRRGFPEQRRMLGGLGGGGMGGATTARILPVENVGEFVASFVPSIADFDRLDPRFVLPKSVWDKLPAYRDWGFAVFQLRAPGKERSRVHPMALEFDTRLSNALFFPTLHIHDGAVHPEEDYDHTLYFQEAELRGKSVVLPARAHRDSYGSRPVKDEITPIVSRQSAERFVAVGRTQGLVMSGEPLQRVELQGRLANQDILLRLAKESL